MTELQESCAVWAFVGLCIFGVACIISGLSSVINIIIKALN